MNRRSFLQGLITTAAGIVLPYEPKRIYSFPSPRKLRIVYSPTTHVVWDGVVVFEGIDHRGQRVRDVVPLVDGQADSHVQFEGFPTAMIVPVEAYNEGTTYSIARGTDDDPAPSKGFGSG